MDLAREDVGRGLGKPLAGADLLPSSLIREKVPVTKEMIKFSSYAQSSVKTGRLPHLRCHGVPRRQLRIHKQKDGGTDPAP